MKLKEIKAELEENLNKAEGKANEEIKDLDKYDQQALEGSKLINQSYD